MESPNPNPDDTPRRHKEDDDPQQEAEEEHGDSEDALPRSQPSRTPFNDLSQIDRDLALARTLQEQERAYLMLRMGGEHGASESGSEYEVEYEEGDDGVENHGSLEGSEYNEDDMDAFDAQDIDSSEYEDYEAFARALQDEEERDVAVRLMALTGLNDFVAEGGENNSLETWQDVDPDDFSYEELIALGEAVGTESRGLSQAEIALLPSISYKTQIGHDEDPDQCVICRLDYEDDDCLIVLPCKHTYHSECITKWLPINKVCPVCSAEVPTS